MDRDFRYEIVYVFPDGNEHRDSRHATPWVAFLREQELERELRAGNHTFFVGVGDREDPERGWITEEKLTDAEWAMATPEQLKTLWGEAVAREYAPEIFAEGANGLDL